MKYCLFGLSLFFFSQSLYSMEKPLLKPSHELTHNLSSNVNEKSILLLIDELIGTMSDSSDMDYDLVDLLIEELGELTLTGF